MTPVPFASTRTDDASRPRLLLVSYNFPPRQSAGALRWRKLSHFLHKAGWDLDVLATPPQAHTANAGGLDDLPPGVQAFPVPEYPGILRRLEDRLAAMLRGKPTEGSVGQPTGAGGPRGTSESRPWIESVDLRWIPRTPRELIRVYKILVELEELRSWTKDAVRLGSSLISTGDYRAVMASGPPWSTTLAASQLAATHSLPLIQDFRDPWGLPQPGLMEKTAHPLGPLVAARLEASVVRNATAVIVNTPTVERAMAELYPWVRFQTILNGVDDIFADSGADPDGPLRIVYAGTIYLDRDPRVLFEPVGALVRELGLTPNDLTVEFVGQASHYEGSPVEALAEAAGLADHFVRHDPMTRADLLSFLKQAGVLVSLPQSTPWSTPSKIYDYMGFNAWLLVFAEPESSTAEILGASDALVLSPRDPVATTAALRQCYEAFRRSGPPDQAESGELFGRGRTGEQLLDLLTDLGVTV